MSIELKLEQINRRLTLVQWMLAVNVALILVVLTTLSK
jgi:hypothetical protein